ncbi:MAG: glycosyltransferase family 4 protein [Verrucomicrobiota bacterium]
MNILYHFRTRGTGAEAVHIAGVAGAFEKLGGRVVFSSPTGVDPRQGVGSSPYKDPGKAGWPSRLSRRCPAFAFELLEIGYNVVAWLRMRELLQKQRFDFIYERHAFFLVSSALLARKRGIPLVVEVNELAGDPRVRKQPLLMPLARWFDRIVFRQASVIVVVSPHLKRRIEGLGVPGEKVLVLPNAVDADDYAQPADGTALRARFGRAEEIVIGFIGWFVEWHRLDLLMEIFAELARTRPQLRLVLVGEGTLRPALEAQAASLGLGDRICFAGAIPHSEIPAAIAAMDVCVVPNSNEYRSPIKLFEYMGQGRLVVAPATEPIAMVVSDPKNGLLFKPEDARSLAETLARAVDDPSLRRTAGEQARRDVLACHTWQRNAETVLLTLKPELRNLL